MLKLICQIKKERSIRVKFGEKTLSKEDIYEGSIIHLERLKVELQNETVSYREIVRHSPAVAIIATKEDKLLLVRQFRKPAEEALLEIPAGMVEEGEDFLFSAQRELEEETTYQAEEWKEVAKLYPSPGWSTECLTVYRAKNLHKVAHPRPQDADEHIEQVWLSLAEAREALEKGEITDMKTAYAIRELEIEYMKEG